jgi:NADPH2:quinone reductase
MTTVVKAIVVEQGATGVVLAMRDLPAQEPGPHQVKIRVRNASVNRADLAQRGGPHQVTTPRDGPAVVGLDAAGDIVEVGRDVTGLRVGDRVMALVNGGLSEEVVVDATLALPIPRGWSYAEGAAGIVGLLTEHDALRTNGALAPGECVLVHAAASAVGLQCVQLARYFEAGLIITTARTERARELLTALGAHQVLTVSDTHFSGRVLELTNGRGADVIIDHVGGPYLTENIRCAAIKGRLVGVGRLGGADGILDMEAVAFKRLRILGVTFRTRDAAEKAHVVAALRAEADLGNETLRPTIDRVMSWKEAEQAQDLLAANSHLGKIVLAVGTAL